MGETITLTAADGHELLAYRAGPADARHGLVVVQEIFGVNGHIRNVCDRFAARGYAVVSPSLFDRVQRGMELGYQPADIARGRALRAKVSDEWVMADVAAAAGALPEGIRAGIVGYCWGGTIAWWGATRTRLFAAASGWYGGGIAATRSEQPGCPVQLHFGDRDSSIPPGDVAAIRAAHPEVEVHVYAGAGHGFGCDARAGYSPDAYATAQERTLTFFAKHLA